LTYAQEWLILKVHERVVEDLDGHPQSEPDPNVYSRWKVKIRKMGSVKSTEDRFLGFSRIGQNMPDFSQTNLATSSV